MDNITLVNQVETPKSSFVTEEKTVTIKSPEKPTKQTSLEVIKNLAISLGSTQQDSEVQYIQDSFNAITTIHKCANQRKEFSVTEDADELAKSYYGRTEYKEPGSLASSTFSIEESGEVTKSYSGAVGITVDHVKDTSYGTIAQTVNFDMLDELKTQMYHAKFELDKVAGVKDQEIQDFEKSLERVREILDVERKELVIKNLQEVVNELQKVDVSTLDPDNRDGLSSAIYNLECAIGFVNKAGFKVENVDSNDQVKNYITYALGLWPKLKEDVRMTTLMNQMLNLD